MTANTPHVLAFVFEFKIKKMNKSIAFLFFLVLVSLVHTGHHNSKKEHWKSNKSARIRNDIFENLFIVYDPTFLSLVWPKIINGVHVNVDHECWDDLSALYKALVEGRAWAYNTVDASGRYQSGFFHGNRLWLGSRDLCFQLDQKYVSNAERYRVNGFVRRERDFNDHSHTWPSYNGKQALTQSTYLDDVPSHRLAYIAVEISLNITKFKLPKPYDIVLGLCLPRSCSPEDVESLVNFSIMLNDNLKSNGTIPRSVKITSLRHIEEYYDVKYDTGAVLVILVTIILVALAIIATIVDYGFINCIKKQTGTLTIDKNKYVLNKQRYDEQIRKQCELVQVFVDLKKGKSTNNKDSGKFNKDILKTLNTEAIKKVVKGNEAPKLTLDVMAAQRQLASCKRCGKYRKQNIQLKPLTTMPACPRQYNTCASLTNTEYRKRDSLFLNLLLSFSLKHNVKRIFNTTMANQDLAVVHLLRIFSTFWIIFIHVSMLVKYHTENPNDADGWMGNYPVLTSGTLAFDTLIFVSGTFSAHHFFYLSSRYTLRELVSCGGHCGKLFQFVCFVTNRVIRLIPPYAYMIFLTAVLSRVSRDTQPVTFPEQDINCDVNWWRNLLYITLFYPQEKQISWYLSTETCLHACGALLCALLLRRRRLALLLLSAVLLAAVGYDVTTAFKHYHRRYSNVFEAYLYMIVRPASRAAPYLVGVLAGWMIHKADGRISVSRLTRCCLWGASVSALATSLVTSQAVRHWSCAWLHAAWPLALLWPALACATDHAGWSRVLLSGGALPALSRLSYCLLLVQGAAARGLLPAAAAAAAAAPPCAHAACLWSYFAGSLALSLAAALALALLLELPACCLLRRLTDYAYS